MALRPLSLTATTVLAAAVFAAADTPTPAPTPAPSPSTRAPRGSGETAAKGASAGAKRSGGPASPTASPSPVPGKTPGHVFTNEDLPAEPSPAAIPSPGPAGTGRGTVTVLPKTAASPVTATPAPPVEPEANPALWQERARVRREAIRNAEKIVADLEQRVAELYNDRGQTNVMDPNREQNRQAQIAQAQADLERARTDLDRARQDLTDLEEDARRKSIPPGWLREQ